MLTPNDVANKKFDRSFGYGYRIDDVQDYLEEISGDMQQLMDEKRDLEKKLEILADKLEEYRRDEDSLRTALLGAQKLGDSVIRESKTKAEIVMRDATIKAETMVDNARRQIEEEQLALAKMQKEVANFKGRLLALYRQHLELIQALPGDEPSSPKSGNKEPREEVPAGDEESPRHSKVAVEGPVREERELREESDEFNPSDKEDREDELEDNDLGEPQDLTEEDETVPARQADPQQESRFGPLKFGDSFGLTRNEGTPSRTLSRKKW